MEQSSFTPSSRVASGAKRHGSRYKARRRALDLLFEAETRDVDPVALVEERSSWSRLPQSEIPPISEYTREIVSGAAVNLDVLDDIIVSYLTDDWELGRIPATDRAILRVAVWELVFNPSVPEATAVVEGTELASQYGGPKASAYINAMLDRVRKDIKILRIQAGATPVTDAEASADAVLGDSAGAEPDEAATAHDDSAPAVDVSEPGASADSTPVDSESIAAGSTRDTEAGDDSTATSPETDATVRSGEHPQDSDTESS